MGQAGLGALGGFGSKLEAQDPHRRLRRIEPGAGAAVGGEWAALQGAAQAAEAPSRAGCALLGLVARSCIVCGYLCL